MARTGELQAARELLARHAGRLRGYLSARHGAELGGAQAVERLVSRAIERALHRAKAYRSDRDGIAFWLFTLGLGLAFDHLRRAQRGAGRALLAPLSPEQARAEFRRAQDQQAGSGAEPPSRKPRWQPEELAVLREMYPRTPNVAIARALNRSVKSVVSKAHTLRLKKDPARLTEMGRQNVSLRNDRREREK